MVGQCKGVRALSIVDDAYRQPGLAVRAFVGDGRTVCWRLDESKGGFQQVGRQDASLLERSGRSREKRLEPEYCM